MMLVITAASAGERGLAATEGVGGGIRHGCLGNMMMTESDAVALAKAHAAQWSVPWHHVVKTKIVRVWWYFSVEWYSFTIDSGDGRVDASIHVESGTVNRFEYFPADPKAHLLPLWAAYPTYTSVTIGWRQSYGEEYMHAWRSFYQSLSEEAKTEYRRKYPPPTDEELGWQGFYEWTDE